MTTFWWIILFSLLSGLLSVLAVSVFLLFGDSHRKRLVPHLISFAIGALLGAALLGLLPHALESQNSIDPHEIFLALLLGLLGFFLLEKFVLWRHCHSHHCEVHTPDAEHHHHEEDNNKAAGVLVLVGDGIHNFVDGILIAAAFLTDIHLGIVTAMAITTHEIPQEVGDFIVLLHSGFTRMRAFLYNVLSSLATVVGAVLAYFSLQDLQQLLPYILAIAASSFLYVAVADLIPGLHKRTAVVHTVQQVVLIGAGVLIIYFTHSSLH